MGGGGGLSNRSCHVGGRYAMRLPVSESRGVFLVGVGGSGCSSSILSFSLRLTGDPYTSARMVLFY